MACEYRWGRVTSHLVQSALRKVTVAHSFIIVVVIIIITTGVWRVNIGGVGARRTWCKARGVTTGPTLHTNGGGGVERAFEKAHGHICFL